MYLESRQFMVGRQFKVGRRTIVHTSSGSGGSPGGSTGNNKIGTWITTSTHGTLSCATQFVLSLTSFNLEPQSEEVSTPNLPKGKVAVTFSSGGGKSSKVSAGKFKGRVLGGGSRANVYGTRCVVSLCMYITIPV